jgi:hypothetical protein
MRVLRRQGAEPSLAVDTSATRGRNNIYVVAIGGSNGPYEWHSYDFGRTFSKPVPYDVSEGVRGGDSDVAVNTNGDVLAVDLAVSHASVQISHDQGKSFGPITRTAFEDDRPWITATGANVYVAYHDFTAEVPVVCISRDGGKTFPECNQAFTQGSQDASECAENTVPSRPLVVDRKTYSLNFLYSCSTQQENGQQPPFGPLHDYYLAQSTDGGKTFQTYTVFKANRSGGRKPNFANIFGTLEVDSSGNYYALMDGTTDDRDASKHPFHVYLMISRDHGHTWSKPIRVDHDKNGRGTHVLAHMTVTTPGNIDVAWYGTSRTGEPNGVCGTIATQSPCKAGFPSYTSKNAPAWHVFMAQSRNVLSPDRRWRQVRVNRRATHYGRICTNGLVCGSSDRSLLDFISVGVDCRGHAHIAYAGNTKRQEKKGLVFVHVSNQVGGSKIARPRSCFIPAPKH